METVEFKKRNWLPEDNQKLIQLWNEGLPVSEISKKLERSESSIYTRISFLRNILGKDMVPMRTPKAESDYVNDYEKKLIQLWNKGLSVSEISKMLKKSDASIYVRICLLRKKLGSDIVLFRKFRKGTENEHDRNSR